MKQKFYYFNKFQIFVFQIKLILLVEILLVSCNNSSNVATTENSYNIAGKWLIKNENTNFQLEGFEIYNCDSIVGINRYTVHYIKWIRKSDSVYLFNESVGTRTKVFYIDTLILMNDSTMKMTGTSNESYKKTSIIK